jgi:hypothetical protein
MKRNSNYLAPTLSPPSPAPPGGKGSYAAVFGQRLEGRTYNATVNGVSYNIYSSWRNLIKG